MSDQQPATESTPTRKRLKQWVVRAYISGVIVAMARGLLKGLREYLAADHDDDEIV